jgi:hypothetical protein
MTVTVGTFTFPNLTAQPFGYQEIDTLAGRTARQWEISGLLTPAEWLDLLGVYDAWRNSRIADEPTNISGVIGTVVSFSGTGPGGQIWTNINCWFSVAPTGTQIGAYISASVTIVDANEQLETILKEEQDQEQEQQQEQSENLPDLGTFTLGSTVLTLLKPVDAYQTNPALEFTATGVHYVTGNLVPYKIKDVEGTTDLTGWNNIRSWYEAQISSVPLAGSYFPISSPTASAENKIIDGVTTVQYTVSIQLGYVL